MISPYMPCFVTSCLHCIRSLILLYYYTEIKRVLQLKFLLILILIKSIKSAMWEKCIGRHVVVMKLFTSSILVLHALYILMASIYVYGAVFMINIFSDMKLIWLVYKDPHHFLIRIYRFKIYLYHQSSLFICVQSINFINY